MEYAFSACDFGPTDAELEEAYEKNQDCGDAESNRDNEYSYNPNGCPGWGN